VTAVQREWFIMSKLTDYFFAYPDAPNEIALWCQRDRDLPNSLWVVNGGYVVLMDEEGDSVTLRIEGSEDQFDIVSPFIIVWSGDYRAIRPESLSDFGPRSIAAREMFGNIHSWSRDYNVVMAYVQDHYDAVNYDIAALNQRLIDLAKDYDRELPDDEDTAQPEEIPF